MLSIPEHGWSKVKINAIIDSDESKEVSWDISGMFNTPVEILKALIWWYKTKLPQSVLFEMEEEGLLAMFITDSSQVLFMNTSLPTTNVYRIIGEDAVDKLCDEVISDIEDNLDAWSNFYLLGNSDNKGSIIELIEELKAVRKKMKERMIDGIIKF